MGKNRQNPFDNVWQVLDYLANNFSLFSPVRDLLTKFNTKVQGYEKLLKEKADDIEYENNKVYLTSYGDRIGDGMTLPDNGLSAYEIWKKNGHEGTEEDFLLDIKGERGPKGEDGKSFSIQGKKDSVSALPTTGQVGEGWLVDGNVYIWDVNRKAWINAGSLKGEKGDAGDRGPQGAQGPRGDVGPKGQQGAQGPRGETGERGSKMYTGRTISGKPTSATTFNNSGITYAMVNDIYLNTDTGNNSLGNMYICTRGGAANTALWQYECNILGAKGNQGDRGPQGPAGQNGSKGEKGDPGLTDEEKRKLEETIRDLINRIESLENTSVVPVESITIKNKLTKMGTNENHIIEYILEPDNATNKQVEFISSNETIASINTSGYINCLKAGETRITVRSKKYPNISDSYALEVANGYASVRGMALNGVPTEMYVNDTATLSVTFIPNNVTNTDVTYRSSDPTVLDVEARTGKITAKSAGFAYITATSDASPFISTTSRSIQVVNRNVTQSIVVGSPINSLRVDKKHNLQLSVLDEYARSSGSFICESSNISVATIDSSGVVTAKSLGTTTITIKLANNQQVTTSFILDTYSIPAGSQEVTVSNGSMYTVAKNEELYMPYTAPVSLSGYSFYAIEHGTENIIGTGYINHGFLVLRATNTYTSVYKVYFQFRKYVTGVGYSIVAQSGIVTINIVDKVTDVGDVFHITNPISRMLVGRTHKITALYDSGAMYSTSDMEVASVDYGVVRALKNGNVTIKGNRSQYHSKFNVTIEGDAGISIDNRVSSLELNKSMNIMYTEYPTSRGVTFTSSDESVLTVAPSGFVYAAGIGKADIIITSNYNGAVREKMTIEVYSTTENHVMISNTIKAIRIGASYKLEGLTVPTTNNDTFTFNSTNPMVLSVDRFGTMIGREKGTASVSIISANHRETFDVRVYDIPLGAEEIFISTLTGENMESRDRRFSVQYISKANLNGTELELVSNYNGQTVVTGGSINEGKIVFTNIPQENLINVYLVAKSSGRIIGQSAPFNLYSR